MEPGRLSSVISTLHPLKYIREAKREANPPANLTPQENVVAIKLILDNYEALTRINRGGNAFLASLDLQDAYAALARLEKQADRNILNGFEKLTLEPKLFQNLITKT